MGSRFTSQAPVSAKQYPDWPARVSEYENTLEALDNAVDALQAGGSSGPQPIRFYEKDLATLTVPAVGTDPQFVSLNNAVLRTVDITSNDPSTSGTVEVHIYRLDNTDTKTLVDPAKRIRPDVNFRLPINSTYSRRQGAGSLGLLNEPFSASQRIRIDVQTKGTAANVGVTPLFDIDPAVKPHPLIEDGGTVLTAAATSVTATLENARAAAAGSLLVSFLVIDKAGLTAAPIHPTGWTFGSYHNAGLDATTGVSIAWAWKKAVGGETAAQWTLPNAESRLQGATIHEVGGFTNVVLDQASTPQGTADVVLSQSTGTTANTTSNNGLALALVGADSADQVELAGWSNGFQILRTEDPALASVVGVFTAFRDNLATGTAAQTTATFTGFGDQLAGVVAVFKDA